MTRIILSFKTYSFALYHSYDSTVVDSYTNHGIFSPLSHVWAKLKDLYSFKIRVANGGYFYFLKMIQLASYRIWRLRKNIVRYFENLCFSQSFNLSYLKNCCFKFHLRVGLAMFGRSAMMISGTGFWFFSNNSSKNVYLRLDQCERLLTKYSGIAGIPM